MQRPGRMEDPKDNDDPQDIADVTRSKWFRSQWSDLGDGASQETSWWSDIMMVGRTCNSDEWGFTADLWLKKWWRFS